MPVIRTGKGQYPESSGCVMPVIRTEKGQYPESSGCVMPVLRTGKGQYPVSDKVELWVGRVRLWLRYNLKLCIHLQYSI